MAAQISLFQGGNYSDNLDVITGQLERYRREQPAAALVTDTAALGAFTMLGGVLLKLGALGSESVSSSAVFVRGLLTTQKATTVAEAAEGSGSVLARRTDALVRAIDEKIASGTALPLAGEHAMAVRTRHGPRNPSNAGGRLPPEGPIPPNITLPRDISWRQINNGIRTLVEDLNAGKFKALEGTPEYENMIGKISARISKFKLSDSAVVKGDTVAAILKNPRLSNAIPEIELQRLISNGVATKPTFVNELMQVPEIAATRLNGILSNGRSVVVRDATGKAVPDAAGNASVRAMTKEEEENVLNRIDLARYDAGHRSGGGLAPAAGTAEAAAGWFARLQTMASHGLGWPMRVSNDDLPGQAAMAAKTAYVGVTGYFGIQALGGAADNYKVGPTNITQALALKNDPFSRMIKGAIEFVWSNAIVSELEVKNAYQKQLGEGQRGDHPPHVAPAAAPLPSSSAPRGEQPAGQPESKLPRIYQQLKTAFPSVADGDIKISAKKACIDANGPALCGP
jgi:hypothetical protein